MAVEMKCSNAFFMVNLDTIRRVVSNVLVTQNCRQGNGRKIRGIQGFFG